MSAVPLILVVGGDMLAVRVCEELCATQGHRVALLWVHDHGLATKLDRLGCDYFPHPPNDYESLQTAGVGDAASIMALSEDDRLNLQVALKARDLNPEIRVVLRQFNRGLGRKVEQNLPNCSVLSLASHSAATFVATALDPSCFYALQFPDIDGVQTGFAERSAAELGVAGVTVATAQQRLHARIVAVDGSPDFLLGHMLDGEERLIVFARVEQLEATSGTRALVRIERRHKHLERLRVGLRKRLRGLQATDPVLRRITAVVATIFALSTVYFAFALQTDPITAFYFVATTFTSTGYGDITPLGHGQVAMIAANLVMFTGVASLGIFIAFATSAVTSAQFTAVQGVRQIRTRGHVLLCGAGNVGSSAVGYLHALHQKVVVIEAHPDPVLIEMSRERRIELLTGDATRDATLDLCNIANARAVVALTDSDTANLEVALGARARNPQVPVVMRVQDEAFADSIARHFEAIRTYSTTALAAPSFAMLSRFPGTRGRIAFGNDQYNVGERLQGQVPAPPPAEHCIPLGVWRRGQFLHIDAFEEMEPYDRLLFLVPLSQFKPASGRRRDDAMAVGTT
ncbi:MAG: NAD-binding protein [Candidatus Eremiobacteraeota bacterium]|nr:NAD-binding protein [Candidatus Eremiobacteraeota bacterium]